MKAARLVSPREFEILQVPTPDPQPGEVLVRMEHLSICGSDLRTYDQALPEASYPLAIGTPCHECAGVVEQSMDESVKPGQRVVALTYAGGLVEYATMPARDAVPVPDSEDPALWVLCQPTGTVLYACQEMGSVLGKRVVVLGQGPIGLTFAHLIERMGATQVIVTDVHDYRLEMSKTFGATHTINARRENVVEAIAEITGGAMADIAVEAVGVFETRQQVFDVLHQKGLAIIFGIPHGGDVFPFNWWTMYEKLPRMIVVNSRRAGEVVDAVRTCVDLVAQGRLDFSRLVTHRMPFEDLGRAYDTFAGRKDGAIKVILSV